MECWGEREGRSERRRVKMKSEKFHDSIFNMIFPIKVQRTRTLLKLCKDNFTQSQSFLFADFSSFPSHGYDEEFVLIVVWGSTFSLHRRGCMSRDDISQRVIWNPHKNYFRAPHFITTTTRHGRKRMELIFIWLWLSSHIFLCFLFKDKYFFVI